ncbi:MAG TPA: Hsp20/alpha crystallin family protein [Actinomycetota bacterium]|jgi:HSP20 family protein|nr:Hsp20/alpha crystallin family protein [Actinomycetota bacterium]
MLAKWDLFRDLRSAEDEFDRIAGRAFSRDTWVPALDVRESEDRFDVTVDLPGLEPGDVNVTFEDGMLSISGKREFSAEDRGETWHRIERSFGTFARSMRLPQTADTERIEATFDKGVLTVSVPKTEQAKPRTIEVRSR